MVPYFFPNSVSLGSSAIVKVPEQVGAAKIPLRKVPRFPVPKQGSQAGFPSRVCKGSQEEVSRRKVPSKRFAGRVPKQGSGGSLRFPRRGSQARIAKVPFPKIHKGSQERVSKQPSQARFAKVPKQGKQSCQEQDPKDFQRFPSAGSPRFPKVLRNRFPRAGFQARFPSKVPRKRFPKIPSSQASLF